MLGEQSTKTGFLQPVSHFLPGALPAGCAVWSYSKAVACVSNRGVCCFVFVYVWLDDNEGSSSDTAPLFQMAGDGKNTDDITIPMLFLFNKEGNIILDAIREYEAVEVLLSDKAKDRGKIKGFF